MWQCLIRYTLFSLFLSSVACQNNPSKTSEEAEVSLLSFEEEDYKYYKDPRDQLLYPTLKIGTQIWMASDLKFETDSSWCLFHQEKNCTRYGRYYTWPMAKIACPEGWHLPSQAEWEAMIQYFKKKGEPINEEGDTDLYAALMKRGTSAMNFQLTGFYNDGTDKFPFYDTQGSYWTSTKFGLNAAMCGIFNQLSSGGGIFLFSPGDQGIGHACRCVKD